MRSCWSHVIEPITTICPMLSCVMSIPKRANMSFRTLRLEAKLHKPLPRALLGITMIEIPASGKTTFMQRINAHLHTASQQTRVLRYFRELQGGRSLNLLSLLLVEF